METVPVEFQASTMNLHLPGLHPQAPQLVPSLGKLDILRQLNSVTGGSLD